MQALRSHPVSDNIVGMPQNSTGSTVLFSFHMQNCRCKKSEPYETQIPELHKTPYWNFLAISRKCRELVNEECQRKSYDVKKGINKRKSRIVLLRFVGLDHEREKDEFLICSTGSRESNCGRLMAILTGNIIYGFR